MRGPKIVQNFFAGGAWLLDLVLPPRCPGCGEIVGDLHSFCPPCWSELDFLGHRGCETCGLPLAVGEGGTCAGCLARPPRIARTRAAVAYGDIARSLAIRLKYGRKVALAKAMARYMAPLLGEVGDDAILVPVPLHRRRIATRGFNQSLLIAREIGRAKSLPVAPHGLRRKRSTPPLKGMSFSQRRRTVSGAFSTDPRSSFAGRTVILVDDVLTTGSTAEACAKSLERAGAARVELICWTRVVRPAQFER